MGETKEMREDQVESELELTRRRLRNGVIDFRASAIALARSELASKVLVALHTTFKLLCRVDSGYSCCIR